MSANRKPKPPDQAADYLDPDLVKAFGIETTEDEEPFGALKKRTVLEIYPKPTGPVKTPFEE